MEETQLRISNKPTPPLRGFRRLRAAIAAEVHCDLCEILLATIHQAHNEPEFTIGRKHSRCREVVLLLKELNCRILSHAETCRRVK